MRTLFIENCDEINRIITACRTCYLAMAEGNQPYVLPMNFALDGDFIVLHSLKFNRNAIIKIQDFCTENIFVFRL